MTYTLLLDALIAILLVATITYCVRLHRKLGMLRKNQGELSRLVESLNEATARAEAGIAGLRLNAEQVGASLQSSIEQAERLNDNLDFLSERGTRLVERLEASSRHRRSGARTPPKPSRSEQEGDDEPPRERLEQELLNALRAAR